MKFGFLLFAVGASLSALSPFHNSSHPAAKRATPTFAKDIAPILYSHCSNCHRPGEVGPFPLLSYDNARKWSKNIANVTATGQMPPWKAVAGHGEFLDANKLTGEQKRLIAEWAEAGAPRGDAASEPKAPSFSSDWALGAPDVVLSPKTTIKLGPEGRDEYRNFVFKTDFKETRYITAMDCKPGNPSIAHHIVVYIDESGTALKRDAQDTDGQEGYLTPGGISPGFIPANVPYVWAPGLRARRLPEGVAFALKPGATLVMQVHYHKNGKDETDKSKFGIYFSKEPAKKNAFIDAMLDFGLKIPAGNSAVPWTQTTIIPFDATMYSIMPHMHLLGKSMKAELILPSGAIEPLIQIDDWDFNWQLNYSFKDPVHIPKGSKIRVSAVYDNSANNPRNPHDPPVEVHFGEQTTDEMFVLIFTVTKD